MPQWIYLYRQWLLRELQLRFRSSALGVAWLVLAARRSGVPAVAPDHVVVVHSGRVEGTGELLSVLGTRIAHGWSLRGLRRRCASSGQG